MTATETVTWGTVEGRTITFPMEVPSLNAATLLFSVSASVAAELLPGDAFEVVEVAPGTAQLVIAVVDYQDNPWGDYDELNLGFLARPAGADASVIGSFVWRMPVNQAFTCAAGNQVMGFPKTVEDLAFTYALDTVTFTYAAGTSDLSGTAAGHRSAAGPELTIRLPRAAPVGAPQRVAAESYSYLDGLPHRTVLSMDMGTGLIDPADVQVSLGDGPVADELRRLGLPTAPDFATWGEGLSATFELGEPI